MRNALALFAMSLFAVACRPEGVDWSDVEAPTAAPLTAAAPVLFVVGSTSLSSPDSALRSRLQSLGATVAVKSATAAQSGDATGKALVVISDSVASGDVNTKFRDSKVPVLCLENALFDDLRMTGPTSGVGFGTTGSQTQIGLAAVSHPLAAGLNLPATSSAQTYAWGVPAAGAIIIATLSGNATRATVFAYDAGQAMVGGAAPARRVGFFAAGNAPSALTSQGWKLFDDAVNWLTARKPDGQPCSAASECTSGVCRGPRFCDGGTNGHCPCTGGQFDCESGPGACKEDVTKRTCGGGDCVGFSCEGTPPSENTCDVHDCLPGEVFAGGTCKKADGQPCTAATECATGTCKGPRFCDGGTNGHCPCTGGEFDCESGPGACKEDLSKRTCGGGDCTNFSCQGAPPAENTCDVHDCLPGEAFVCGQCKKKDGQPCTTAAECATGTCKGPRFCNGGTNAHCPCTGGEFDCESGPGACQEDITMRTCGGGDCVGFSCNGAPPERNTCDVHN